MSVEPEIRLLLELDPEAVRWRRRAMFLLSIVAHAVLALILVFSPDILQRSRIMMGLPPEEVQQKPEMTYLFIPQQALRHLAKRETPPNPNNLSDKDRRSQGRSPVIDPRGLHMPYSRGNTKLPEIAGGATPKPPPAPPTPPPGGPTPGAAKKPAQPAPETPTLEAKNEGLRLEDVKPPQGGNSRVQLPSMTPGQSIQRSLQAAVQGRMSGVPGPGDSNLQFENIKPNFSTEAPIILSDTRGVDFGPYLARIVYIVRRNWYSVIPESARLGEKGRVGIVFEILKDGSVPQLRLVASSGSDPLDRAAVAGIRASIPFPPLPSEFTGRHLVLQFIFLYNIGYGP